MARYLDERKFRLDDPRERDQLLYWYVHTFLWGRYAGSTETVLNQDLALIEQPDGALERLIAELRRHRGDLRLQPNDFLGWSKGARFYPLLYMMTRVGKAKDWGDRDRAVDAPARQAEPARGAPRLSEGPALQARLQPARSQRARQLHLPDPGDEPPGVEPGPGQVP